ncbi:unnamed protein product, partial [Bubo scandiacus]
MKVISTNKFILFALATAVFLTSNSMCLDEPMKSSPQSREDDDDKYYEIKDNTLEEKQRSLNFEEMKDWGSKNIIKMNPPALNKMPNSIANLPLRFGRNYPEERSIKPFANLPLRFGRAFGENIPRHALKVSHRLGRSPLIKSASQSLLNLPQRFGKSLSVDLSQDIQESEPGRSLEAKTYFQQSLAGSELLAKGLPKFAEEKGQKYYLNPLNIMVPNSTFKELEYNFSARTPNMLQNTERALGNHNIQSGLHSCQQHMTAIQTTFCLEEYDLSQVRPLEGCTVCLLQGQCLHKSILQEQYSSSVQMPLPLFRVPTVLSGRPELESFLQARQPAWRPEDRPRETALPEWIPSCEVPRHQTALLELQHSFSKTAAQKRFHDSQDARQKTSVVTSLRERDPNSMISMFFISLT